jgi:ATP/maltotriose-dependent transcriptional regulator MalT
VSTPAENETVTRGDIDAYEAAFEYLADALAVAARTFEQAADMPGVAQSFAAAISGVAALGNGELHTAIAHLRGAVSEFPNRTDGRLDHFGISYAEALAHAGDVDAAAEALAEMRRNRHPGHRHVESASLLAAAWVAAARTRFASTGPVSGGG